MQQLSNRLSAKRIYQFANRHIRLVKRTVNDTALIAQIQPALDNLKEKMSQLERTENQREESYDDLILAHGMADNALRNLFSECQRIDRSLLSENVVNQIFPDGKFGQIIRLPFADEVLALEEIVKRINALGAEHPMAKHAEEIRNQASLFQLTIDTNQKAINEVRLAQNVVEIAKENLIRQYEINTLDARKKYGKKKSDLLFPKIEKPKTKTRV